MENLGPIANGTINANGESLFNLGMMFATGCSRPFCLVSAHVCFNFAATQGNERAIELRQEVATEMSREQIAAAQRARWAKVKASKSQSRNGNAAPKRAISAAARRRMAVAQRARWAKVRAGKKAA